MTPAAKRQIAKALASIQAAQNLLNDACEQLSPVVGLSEEWERRGRLYDKTKAEWHRLNQLDGPFRLDSEPKAAASIRTLAHPEES
jgi:hypothetical protein